MYAGESAYELWLVSFDHNINVFCAGTEERPSGAKPDQTVAHYGALATGQYI